MDLRQLEAFAAVMSAGSITGAARLLEAVRDCRAVGRRF